MLERLYQNKRAILKKSQENFLNSSKHTVKIGCELEFFLLGGNKDSLEESILELNEKLTKKFPLIYKVEKEQGASQIEVKTDFTDDLLQLCDELEEAKKFLSDFAKNKNLIASFAAQPFVDDCGSALQFNISLHENEKNIFCEDKKLIAETASSLLQNTDEMMIFLAPQQDDYRRFSFEINRELFKKGKFSAPVNLSFGADNRTCAIRIPAKNKRLEYRIAAAGADPQLCVAAILLAMKAEKSEFEQIFGNAFDEKYQLKNFSRNLEEAQQKFFAEENSIRKKLESFL